MCGYHSRSPRRSCSPSRSSHDERRGERYPAERRRSRSPERRRGHTVSSRYDRGRDSGRRMQSPTSRYDKVSNQRRRSRERSRSRTRYRSPPGSRRERSSEKERSIFSADRQGYFRVSHRENVSKSAGKIAWNARRDEKMKPLLASGPAAVATALGILAKVRKFLAEDESPRDLLFVAVYEEKKQSLGKIIFHLKVEPERMRETSSNDETLTVSSRSKIASIAGAIAKRVRGVVIMPRCRLLSDEVVCL